MFASHALVVLSGGQDSTTCLAQALATYGRDRVHAITFDYRQRHRAEIVSAQVIAEMAGIKDRHEVLTLPGILKGSSPLVNRSTEVEQYASADVLPGGLEKTFVPMRNQLFMTLAANRAVCIGLEKGADVDIIVGVSQEDYGGYPDCRQPFIYALEEAIKKSLDDPDLPKIKLVAPLMFLTKKMTVELSEKLVGNLGEPSARKLLAHSHTCYNGLTPPCGKCHACLLREKGYAEAGVSDPLIERLRHEMGDDEFMKAVAGSIPPVQ